MGKVSYCQSTESEGFGQGCLSVDNGELQSVQGQNMACTKHCFRKMEPETVSPMLSDGKGRLMVT